MSKAPDQPILVANQVAKIYDMPAGPLSVLTSVDFTLNRGEMSFIIGRSGSGKSTLLHVLGGLDEVTSGQILFEGEDITQMKDRELSYLRNICVGFVFQFYHLLPELTVYENVMLPAMIMGKKEPEWCQELLKRVNLLGRKGHFPSQLSGGEQQRAAIARALINRPGVVFCDEPTGNLDDETAESVFAVLEELNRDEEQAFVIVTHDESLAWRYPHHVYRLQDGLLAREERTRLKRDASAKIKKVE